MKHIRLFVTKVVLWCSSFLLATPQFSVFAQENLILNPSGENMLYPTCCGTSCYVNTLDWWFTFPENSPDSYCSQIQSNCVNQIPINWNGIQLPLDGSYYFGIVTCDYEYDLASCWLCRVEYVAGTFSQPLVKDKIYRFECWVSKAEKNTLISNALDVLIAYNLEVDVNNFSDDGYVIWSEETPMTDTLNWVKVSACFKAKGGEKGFAMGNFHELSNVSYTYLGNSDNEWEFDYRYLDAFSLIECPTCCPEQFPVEEQIALFGNPSADGQAVSLEMWLKPATGGELRVYDSAGRLVAHEYYLALKNTYTFGPVAGGVYHYHFTTTDGYSANGKVVLYGE